MKNSNIYSRAKFSVAGLHHAWVRELSFRTQIFLSAAVLFALILLQPSGTWWAIIVLAMASASAIEVLNGALEAIIDQLHPARHHVIGMAKDMASAAAFIVNCATVVTVAIMALEQMR